MNAVAPPFALVAALLAAAGLAKLRSPEATAATLSRLELPATIGVVRLLGTAEVALGAACLLSPARLPAAALAVAYVVFALVIVALIRAEGPAVPCGCFGAGSFSPARAHVGLDLLAAMVAIAAAIAPPAGPLDWFGDPLGGAAATAALACSVWLAFVIFTLVTSLWTAEAR